MPLCLLLHNKKGYADKSMEIIRGYSASLKKPVYSARQAGLDHVLMVGNLCIKLVYAVELMRYLDGSGMTKRTFREHVICLSGVLFPY